MRQPIIAALTVVIGVILASQAIGKPLVGVIQSHPAPKGHPPASATHNKQGANAKTTQAPLAPKTDGEQAKTTNSEASIKTDNEEIQKRLANYTLLLVVVGFLQAGVLLLTVLAIYNQIRITKTSERAWLLAGAVHWEDTPKGQGFYPMIVNFGKTVARIKAVHVTFRVVQNQDKLPPIPVFGEEMTAGEDWDFVLYPQGEVRGPTVFISYERLRDVYTGLFKLYIYGFIHYYDLSETELRSSCFCMVQDKALGKFRPDTQCPHSYNKCT